MGDLRGDLNRMLDQYDERRNIAQARERQVKADEERFLAGFAELRRTIVRPVFESAAAVLAERGHGVGIAEKEFARDPTGKATEAQITLRISPLGWQGSEREDEHLHSLSITTRHYNKTVWINAGTAPDPGGIAGARGAYALEKVDHQLVEEALLEFVAGVVAA